jgi:hypothetical protein
MRWAERVSRSTGGARECLNSLDCDGSRASGLRSSRSAYQWNYLLLRPFEFLAQGLLDHVFHDDDLLLFFATGANREL